MKTCLTIRKGKSSLTMKNMKLGTREYMFYHRVHRGHGGKNLSQRIYAGRPHKIH